MLLDGKRSITEAAMEAGFQSIRTFNRVFSSQNGITPGEYRRAVLEELERSRKEK